MITFPTQDHKSTQLEIIELSDVRVKRECRDNLTPSFNFLKVIHLVENGSETKIMAEFTVLCVK